MSKHGIHALDMKALRSSMKNDSERRKRIQLIAIADLQHLHKRAEICLTISEYFRHLGPTKFHKAKPNVSPEAQPWPSSITDIIPSPGAECDVLVALVQ
jgi:hypothetical protein